MQLHVAITLRMSRRTSLTRDAHGPEVRAAPSAWFAWRRRSRTQTYWIGYRGSAPPPGPLLGVPSVQWAAKHRPVAGKREAHPQRLPVHFFFLLHGQKYNWDKVRGIKTKSK